MGLLNFEERFVPLIEADEKRHTIRAKRKYPLKVGDVCHLYTGLRHKGARLLKRRRCVKVQEITIERVSEPDEFEVYGIKIDGEWLNFDEINSLAWRDGFRPRSRDEAFTEMLQFWEGRLPFTGDIIHWESDAAYKKRNSAGKTVE